ncbi:MAG: hypothetical protein ABFC94_18355 [Syntrophomonas sp.]
MEELTLVQKFDTVLEMLYLYSGKRPTSGRVIAFIRAKNKKIDPGEVWDIMNRMVEDKLVSIVAATVNKKQNTPLYLLKFEGKIMYERGGLKGKLKREKNHWTQRHPVLYALISGIGGAILALVVGLSLWWVDKRTESQENQETKQTISDANHRLDSVVSVLNNIPDSLRKKK